MMSLTMGSIMHNALNLSMQIVVDNFFVLVFNFEQYPRGASNRVH